MGQSALTRALRPNPYRRQRGAQLVWGKISGRHPESGRVDVTLDKGAVLPNVPFLPQALGRATGETYLPATSPVDATPSAVGPYGVPTPGNAPDHPDMYAVVGWLEGSGRQPVVLGILPPPNSAMAPTRPGWHVRRHESGEWDAVDPAGNWTRHWPDGTTLSVTQAGQPATASDINPAFPAPTGPAVTIRIATGAGASIVVSGNTITLNGGTAGVARVGDSVQVNVSGTVYTGTITSGSSTVTSG